VSIDRASGSADDPADGGEGEAPGNADRRRPPEQPGTPGTPSMAASEVNRKPSDAEKAPPGGRPSAETPQDITEQDTPVIEATTESDDTGTGRKRAEGSPLEQLPSYGGFDNLSQEFDARAKSRQNARALNSEIQGDAPDNLKRLDLPEDSNSQPEDGSQSDESLLRDNEHDSDTSKDPAAPARRLEGEDRDKRTYSGELVKVDKPDADADKLAERIGGESRVRFNNDPSGREFDAVSDQYIGQAKPADFVVNKKFRVQAKASFDAAQETGRAVYYHFDGPPDPAAITKLNEYSQRYGIKLTIDTRPFE
jgi:hypothetical protein